MVLPDTTPTGTPGGFLAFLSTWQTSGVDILQLGNLAIGAYNPPYSTYFFTIVNQPLQTTLYVCTPYFCGSPPAQTQDLIILIILIIIYIYNLNKILKRSHRSRSHDPTSRICAQYAWVVQDSINLSEFVCIPLLTVRVEELTTRIWNLYTVTIEIAINNRRFDSTCAESLTPSREHLHCYCSYCMDHLPLKSMVTSDPFNIGNMYKSRFVSRPLCMFALHTFAVVRRLRF